MRICIIGAGAVGGLLAARLGRAGESVSVLARGRTLEAIRADGLRVRDKGGEWSAQLAASADPDELGVQDAVVIATKAHALPAIAAQLAPLLGESTCVVTAVNGLPWWYFHATGSLAGGPHLDTVDPGGRVWAEIGPARALGCVVHFGASQLAPGRIAHAYGAQLVLGEPDGSASPRVEGLAAALAAAGFKVRVSDDVRAEVWKKLWYNLAINPISVITGAACDRISADADLCGLLEAMIVEGGEVARALGVEEPLDAAEHVRGFGRIGAFKTSMLQDMESGRPIELDPILGAVVELAGRLGVEAPRCREVFALARARAAAAGCYRPMGDAAREAA